MVVSVLLDGKRIVSEMLDNAVEIKYKKLLMKARFSVNFS